MAQLASQYPQARDSLLEQARQNQIPPITWSAIAPILAGDQVGFQYSAFDGTATSENKTELMTTHLASGNQNFYSAPLNGILTSDQVAQRLDLIQQLSAAAVMPAAQQALKTASDLLTRRGSVSTSGATPGH